MKKNIAVIGDGGWGTTIAILLAGKGHEVTLWGAFPDYIEVLKKERVNKKFLPDIKIPREVNITSGLAPVKEAEIVCIAVPSKYLRKELKGLKGNIKGEIVSLTKGIEEETLLRPSEIIKEILGAAQKITVLSGPSISYEVVRKMPTTVIAASENEKTAKGVQDIFATPYFRVYTSEDVTGVELGGALKNIIAIAAGISDGMGFGINTKSAILTRGLAETIRLGLKLGAKKETFFGLSGLGDLATTCMSAHSRNRRFGEEIGKGKRLEDILKSTQMVVEGITTAKSAYSLSKKVSVEMPIIEKIYEVLYEEKNSRVAVKELMGRAQKTEKV
ncbi:MAG: NAD(P)-dependent glycerol-3-phosphate dehydrogenase [Candidatus Omnitrophica bacterium]|nr:NAD(P)-dependent glycerol-3-phosphate dehydrogenase [Candidatus Omnitrophota bacterium]